MNQILWHERPARQGRGDRGVLGFPRYSSRKTCDRNFTSKKDVGMYPRESFPPSGRNYGMFFEEYDMIDHDIPIYPVLMSLVPR